MLEYVEKLTLTPSSMKEEDVQKLRDAGWTDRDILDICQVAAYFNYRVRMADGLGVELDEAYNQSAQSSRERAREEAKNSARSYLQIDGSNPREKIRLKVCNFRS
jgi:uncharacterized protein YciW